LPHIIKQPIDTGLVPNLNCSAEARTKLRCGHNKWERIKHEIEHVRIGPKDFWTDEALAAYVRRQTRRPPAKGRGKRDAEERSAP
jgi:hypothetical protein